MTPAPQEPEEKRICPVCGKKQDFTNGMIWVCKDLHIIQDAHTPAQPAQQRIDAAIKELEKEIADQKELIATTDGHHKEIHESILNTLEFAIALLREGEQG